MKEPITVNIIQIFSISYIPVCKCLVANKKKTKWRVVKPVLKKKKRLVIEIGSDTSDRICHTVGNQFYLTNGEKCHRARSFQSFRPPQQPIERSLSEPSGAHLKTARRCIVSSCVVSSSFACHLVFSDGSKHDSAICKASQAAEWDRSKPLPPFKVWRTLIFPSPPIAVLGECSKFSWGTPR